MTIYRHTPGGLVRNTRYRVDTASGSASAATIQSPNDDTPIPGSIVTTDLLAHVVFEGSAATLYLKELGWQDVPSGVVVTSAGGVAQVDPALPASTSLLTVEQASGTYAPLVSPALTGTPTVNGTPIGTGGSAVGSNDWLKNPGNWFITAVSASDTATGLPTSGTVTWSDGTTGTFAGTVNGTAGDYSGYVVTYAGGTTKTVTATGITYDANGNRLGPTGLVVS